MVFSQLRMAVARTRGPNEGSAGADLKVGATCGARSRGGSVPGAPDERCAAGVVTGKKRGRRPLTAIPDSGIPDSGGKSPDWPRVYDPPPRHPSPFILHPSPFTLHPSPFTLHPSPFTLHPSPFTLHPSPFILHPSSFTLHPSPFILHPSSFTLHPSPFILHPSSFTLQNSSFALHFSSICMVRFIRGVTSPKTASMDSTRSGPVEVRTSSSVMG